jgi:hypothetical protein
LQLQVNELKISKKHQLQTMSNAMHNLDEVKSLIISDLTSSQAVKAVAGLSIQDSTKFCEAAVPEYCIKTTCPQFCSTFRTQMSRTRCSNECAKDKRCKLKPDVGQDDPKNQILDAQNRDQLWACIAEKRDPKATTTGRRTTPWQDLKTPSFEKAIRPQA